MRKNLRGFSDLCKSFSGGAESSRLSSFAPPSFMSSPSDASVVGGYAQQRITQVRFSKFKAGATLRFILQIVGWHENDVDVRSGQAMISYTPTATSSDPFLLEPMF